MFSYKKLFKKMIDAEITKTQLTEQLGISTRTMAKLSKNEYVSLDVIDRICEYFDCNVSDIMEYIQNKKE